jgi:hypothetical protein
MRGQEFGGLLQPTRVGKVWVRSGICINPDALFKVLERLAKSAGLKDISPHDLRPHVPVSVIMFSPRNVESGCESSHFS